MNFVSKELYNVKHVNAIEDRFRNLDEVSKAIRDAGLEKSQLIFGIDFTISNLENGTKTFNGRSLHYSEESIKNPYQKVKLSFLKIHRVSESIHVMSRERLLRYWARHWSVLTWTVEFRRSVSAMPRPKTEKSFHFRPSATAMASRTYYTNIITYYAALNLADRLTLLLWSNRLFKLLKRPSRFVCSDYIINVSLLNFDFLVSYLGDCGRWSSD